MYKIVFYFCGINRAGSEIALLRYLKNTKKRKNILIAYDKDDSDEKMIEEFSKYSRVIRIEEDTVLETETAVNCMISSRENSFFDKIKANKRILWVQINPQHGNYKDFERYDSFLGTSQYIKKMILEYENLGKQSIYIANPITDFEEIRKLAEEKQDIINPEEVNLITIARVTKEKGYEHIIKIAEKLKQRGLNIRWYMLGFIPELKKEFYYQLCDEIKDRGLEKNIIFMGATPNPYKYLKQAKINILLSENESWGLAITEAKALAIPSIATNNSGLKEQINSGKNGYLVDLPKKDKDYEEIVDIIQNLIKNDVLYNEMVEQLKYEKNNISETVKTMDECFWR